MTGPVCEGCTEFRLINLSVTVTELRELEVENCITTLSDDIIYEVGQEMYRLPHLNIAELPQNVVKRCSVL